MSKLYRLTVLVVLLSMLLPLHTPAVQALVANDVQITMATDPYMVLDSNKPCVQGPNAAYVGFAIKNISGTTKTNLRATLGGFGNGYLLTGGQQATQYIGTLAANATDTVYWLVKYPCTFNVSQQLSVTVVDSSGVATTFSKAMTNPLPLSPARSDFGTTLLTYSTISANAGGLVVDSRVSSVATIGGVVEVEVEYEFGSVNPSDRFNFQPGGVPGFNAGCYQLLNSELMYSELEGVGVATGSRDSLLYFATGRQGGSGNTARMKYFFQANCVGSGSSLKAYASQTSGNTNVKYTGNYDTAGAMNLLTLPGVSASSVGFDIKKTVSPAVLASAGSVEYTVVISNTSGITSTLERITDTLPTGVTFSQLLTGSGKTSPAIANYLSAQPSAGATGQIVWIGGLESAYFPYKSFTIGPNSSIQLVYRANVPGTTGTYTNSARAATGNYTTGVVSASVGVGQSDLSIGLSAATSVTAGSNIVYTATVNNLTSSTNSVTMSFPLPAEVTFQSITAPTGWVCTNPAVNTTGTVRCTLTSMPGSSSAVFTITTKSSASLPNLSTVSATATVSGTLNESTLSNNTATVNTNITGPVLAATKDYVMSGIGSSAIYTYTVVVSNTGSASATSVLFEDIPDSNTALVTGSLSTSAGSIVSGNAGTPPVKVNIGTLAAGAKVTIKYSVRPKLNLPASVASFSNQGTVTATGVSPVKTDFPQTTRPGDPTVAPYQDRPIIDLFKDWELHTDVNGNGLVDLGDNVKYTFTLINIGSTMACTVNIYDGFDPNSTLESGTITAGGDTSACVVGNNSYNGTTIVQGNTSGDTAMEINAYGVPPGGVVVMTAVVKIKSNLSPSIREIVNQARASYTMRQAVVGNALHYYSFDEPNSSQSSRQVSAPQPAAIWSLNQVVTPVLASMTNTPTNTTLPTNTPTNTTLPTNTPTNTTLPTNTPTNTATASATGSPTQTATAQIGTGAWQLLGGGAPNQLVSDSVFDASGNLYVVGQFTAIGGQTLKYVAKWTRATNTWGGLAGGLNGAAQTIDIDANGDIIVGGGFSSALDASNSNVTNTGRLAKWDVSANAWVSVVTINTGTIYDITTSGNNILVAGTTNGSVSGTSVLRAFRLLESSGTYTVDAMDSGVNNDAYSIDLLNVSGTDYVYVGGIFTQIGNPPTNGRYFARYNTSTTTWEQIPATYFADYVLMSRKIGSRIYFGGRPSGSGVSYIGYTDGSTISGFGTGISAKTNDIVIDNNNDAWLCGAFTTPGKYVAKLTNSAGTWGAVTINGDTGFNDECLTISYDTTNNNLIAGGKFTGAYGDTSMAYLVQWNPTGVQPTITPTQASTAISSSAYFGFRSETSTGGMMVRNVGRATSTPTRSATPVTSATATPNAQSRAASVTDPSKAGLWTLVASAAPNGEVRAVNQDTTGNIYIGGNFTSIGGQSINRFAKFDGTSWSALGANNEATGVIHDIVVDGTTSVYLAGSFVLNTNPCDVVIYDVATDAFTECFDMDGTAYTLLFNSQKLYVGGDFNTTTYVSASSFMAFTPDIAVINKNNTIGTLDGGVTGATDVVYDLDADANGAKIYAAGTITQVGMTPLAVNNLAVFSGNSWSQAYSTSGTQINGTVRTIYFDRINNFMFVGGEFTAPGNRIAKYDIGANTWVTFPNTANNGLSGTVYDIGAEPNGDFYMCGAFGTANNNGTSVTVNSIARYDTSANTWFTLKDSSNTAGLRDSAGTSFGTCYDIMVISGTGLLYVGGNYDYAGSGSSLKHFTRWYPSGLATPTPQSVTNTPSNTLTPSITKTPSLTFTPSNTRTASATFTASSTRTPSLTFTVTPSKTPTRTRTATATAASTAAASSTATVTRTPSVTNTPTASLTHTATASLTPTTVHNVASSTSPFGFDCSNCPTGLQPGMSANSLYFDGANDTLTSRLAVDLRQSWSIGFWLKRDSSSVQAPVLSQGSAGSDSSLYVGFNPSNASQFIFRTNGSNLVASGLNSGYGTRAGTRSTSAAQWHYYTISYDVATLRRSIYIDGVLAATDIAPSAYTLTNAMLAVGMGTISSTTYYLNGYLDLLGYYDTALTADEVEAIFAGLYPDVAARWLLDGSASAQAYADIVNNSTLVLDSGQIAPTPNALTVTSTVSGTLTSSGSAMQFTGWNGSSGTSLRSTNTYDLDDGFTIALWAKRSRGTNVDDWMISTDFGVGSENGALMNGVYAGFDSAGNVAFHVGDNTSGNKLSVASQNDTNFHHWIFSYDAASNIRSIYKDGVLLDNAVGANKLNVGAQTVRIGGLFWYSQRIERYFQGYVDRVELFSGPTSPGTAQSIYTYATLAQVGEYPLDRYNDNSEFTNSLGGLPISCPAVDAYVIGCANITTGYNATGAGFVATTDGTNVGTPLEITQALDYTEGYTIAYWAKADSTSAIDYYMHNMHDSTASGGASSLYAKSDGTVEHEVQTVGTSTAVTTDYSEWRRYAVVYDGTQHKIYIDGELADTQTATSTLADAVILFGGFTNDITAPTPYRASYNGAIDDISLYKKALTAAEIATDFSTYGGTVVSDNRIDSASGNTLNCTTATCPVSTTSDAARGNALAFDGTQSLTSVANVDFRTDWSIAFWGAISLGGSTQAIMGTDFLPQNNTLSVNRWFGAPTANGMATSFHGNDTYTTTAPDATLHHYVFTYNHTTFARQIYVDGVLAATSTSNGTAQYAGLPSPIFVGSWDGQYFLDGTIDELAIYDAILSSGDISTLYNGVPSGSTCCGTIYSDWSDTPTVDDPTIIPLYREAKVSADKNVSLVNDDGDGVPEAGESLLYTVDIVNTGSDVAKNIVFNDIPDTKTTLTVGSVTSSLGSVITGNTTGNKVVKVVIGDLASGGGSAKITFRVTINSPIAAGAAVISNQGTISGDNIPSVPTNDPRTAKLLDPTDTYLLADAKLVASKSGSLHTDVDANGSISAGDYIQYRVQISNVGNGIAADVVYRDTLVNMTYQSLSGDGVNQTSGAVIDVSFGDINPGGSVSITYITEIDKPLPAGVTFVSNQGLLTCDGVGCGKTDDPKTSDPEDPTMLMTNSEPTLEVRKQALLDSNDSDGVVGAGDLLNYSIEVRNTGTANAVNAFLNDIPDSNGRFVVGSVKTSQGTIVMGNVTGDVQVQIALGDIAPNGVATISYQVRIPSTLPSGVQRLINQATVSGDNFATEPSDDPTIPGPGDPTVVYVVAKPELSVIKDYMLSDDRDGDGVTSAGDELQYVIQIYNSGNATASSLSVTDQIPDLITVDSASIQVVTGTLILNQTAISGTVTLAKNFTVAKSSLPAGQTLTIRYTANITNAIPAGYTTFSNQAIVTGSNVPQTPSDNPKTTTPDDPTTISVSASPLMDSYKAVFIIVDADEDRMASAGDTLLYRISTSNLGSATASGVIISDKPDASSDLVVGSVTASNGSVTTGNSGSDSTVVVNAGSIPVGSTHVITYKTIVKNPLPTGAVTLSNQAGIVGSNFPVVKTDDPRTSNIDDPTRVTVVARPILKASKQASLLVDDDGDGMPSAGDTLSYKIIVRNSGATTATNVVLTDTLDTNLSLIGTSIAVSRGSTANSTAGAADRINFTIGALPPNETAELTYNAVIRDPLPAGVSFVENQAIVTSSNAPSALTDDPTTTKTNDPTRVPVAMKPVISMTKSATLISDANSNGFADVNDVVAYTITINNTGNGDATMVEYNDTIDSITSFVTGQQQTSAGTITVTGGSISVAIGTIPAKTSATLSYEVNIDGPIPSGKNFANNQGILTLTELPPIVTDDPSTPTPNDPTRVPLVREPFLQLSKQSGLAVDLNGDGDAQAGDVLEYVITLYNVGNDTAYNVRVVDNPDPATTLARGSVTTTHGAVVKGNGSTDTSLMVSVGSLLVGEIAVVSYRVTVINPLPAGVSRVCNQAVSYGSNAGNAYSNDPATSTNNDKTCAPVTQGAQIDATKTVKLVGDNDGDGVPTAGDDLEYIITVDSVGTLSAINVVMTDTLDANVTLVGSSSKASQGTTNEDTSGSHDVVVYTLGTIAKGNSVTASFRATINTPVPSGVKEVSNQAVITGANVPPTVTDDPNTTTPKDPTKTSVDNLPNLSANKQVYLLNDRDNNGYANRGDLVGYSITVRNSGNATATNVVIKDIPDSATTLITGTVLSTIGTVIVGNGATDKHVEVDVGNLLPNTDVAVDYGVFIVTQVNELINQGLVSSDNNPDVPTDDPKVVGLRNPTKFNMTNRPKLTATKQDVHFFDANNDGVVDPDDELLYRITIANTGNATAMGVVFNDLPDINAPLVVGSVTTSAGSVTNGNTIGHTSVRVAVGSIPAGNSVDITFKVKIVSSIPAGVSSVSNQGRVDATSLPTIPTDDPDTTTVDDPTVTPLVVAPVIVSEKDSYLSNDRNGDGIMSEGDEVAYTVIIENRGNADATGASFADTPDASTSLVVGSVQSSLGSITTGNTAGDTSIDVNIGTIPAGASATVTYRVDISSPLPAGVTDIKNQGSIYTNELPPVVTADPRFPTPRLRTSRPVVGIPKLVVTKAALLATDVNANGTANAGDVLSYRIVIKNVGSVTANSTALTDTLDTTLILDVTSIVISQGSARGTTTGNADRINALIGNIRANEQVELTYRATIKSPLPAGVTTVVNQALVTGTNTPSVLSDDPTTTQPDDPTRVNVSGNPEITATKQVVFVNDVDGDGNADAGDTLGYIITINNVGGSSANNLEYSDPIDHAVTYVASSAQASIGSINVTSAGGRSVVGWTIGTLARNTSVTAGYEVTVNSPIPNGVTTVSNQGIIKGTGIPEVPTDDPDTTTPDDPTLYPLDLAPVLRLSKRSALAVDVNGDGFAQAGDTLEYIVTVVNSGKTTATNTRISDVPHFATTLVNGSVRTSLGSVTLGNTVGDRNVAATIGDLPINAQAVISYRVLINTPLALGVSIIENQATARADNAPQVFSDDPTTILADDPTRHPVVAGPQLSVTKKATLHNDNDADGAISAGDDLRYTIVVRNTGQGTATNTLLTDTLDINMDLDLTQVVINRGSAVGANTNPDRVTASIGALAPGSSATLIYVAQIANPMPGGYREVRNQAIVKATETPIVLSDDPTTPTPKDPTVVFVASEPNLVAQKIAGLDQDLDNNGYTSAGDIIVYQVTIRNTGNTDATGVRMTDLLDSNTTLLVGSVKSTVGTVVSGNAQGDSAVEVSIGTLPAGRVVVVTYRATIANPLDSTVKEVSNQAIVSSNTQPDVPTDDPIPPGSQDPTKLPVTGNPILRAAKTAVLFSDINTNGIADANDKVLYNISVRNSGNATAQKVVLSDVPDLNGDLDEGTVMTTRGIVKKGNTVGDRTILVDIGALARGETATISYIITVRSPIPDGITHLVNQATITASNAPPAVTDDPDTTTPDDPTKVPVSAEPVLNSIKSSFLSTDNDGDGITSPGDELQYVVEVTNSGGAVGTSIVMTDTIDPDTTFVVGSARSSQGTTNINGQTITANIGDIPPGETVTISYRVTINIGINPGKDSVDNQAIFDSRNFPRFKSAGPLRPRTPGPTQVYITPKAHLYVTLDDILLIDDDNTGIASGGDTLGYTAEVYNTGVITAENVIFSVAPDINTTLIIGSVITGQGQVLSGNRTRQTTVEVALGDIPPGEKVIISYKVLVKRNISTRIMFLSTQAETTSDNVQPTPSDDPETFNSPDPTLTILGFDPYMDSFLDGDMLADNDNNGYLSPGDTIRYVLTVHNHGIVEAVNTWLTDTLEANTNLVVGSVTTSHGTIINGNNPGDTFLQVNAGTVPAQTGVVMVSYDAIIDNPVSPPSTRQIIHQTQITFNAGQRTRMAAQGAPRSAVARVYSIVSDDPEKGPTDDPTAELLGAGSYIDPTKSASLVVDSDRDGLIDPGDIIQYRVTSSNMGSSVFASGVISDTPDAKTTLINGSVQATRGTVVVGNTSGQTRVEVHLDDLEPGDTATVSYRVQVNAGATGTLTNQALVIEPGLDPVPTDDPESTNPDDPTEDTIGQRPTAIDLSRFSAQRTATGTLVEWETTNEVNTWKYRIYRVDASGKRSVVSKCTNIPATGSVGSGATYRCIDKSRKAVSYILEEITFNGAGSEYTTAVNRNRIGYPTPVLPFANRWHR